MIAALAEPTGHRTVRVAQLRFGKLVRDADGPVHFDAGYAVTYKTADFLGNGKCLPDGIIGGLQLNESHLEPDFHSEGGLVFRLVDLPDGARVVVMRARLRPEAGDGRSGRNHIQATVLQTVTGDGWAGMPSGFPAWCADELTARPDIFSVPLAQRQPIPALEFEPGEASSPTRDDLGRLSGRRRARLVSIIRAIIEGTPLVVGGDGFDPEEAGLADAKGMARLFLSDVSQAFAFLASRKLPVPNNLVIAVGFTGAILPGGVRLLVSKASSPTLDETLDALDEALARRAPRQSRQRVVGIGHASSAGTADGHSAPNMVHKHRDDLEQWTGRPADHRDLRQSSSPYLKTKSEPLGRAVDSSAHSFPSPPKPLIDQFSKHLDLARNDEHLIEALEILAPSIAGNELAQWSPFDTENKGVDGATDATRCLGLIVSLVGGGTKLLGHFSLTELLIGLQIAKKFDETFQRKYAFTKNWISDAEARAGRRYKNIVNVLTKDEKIEAVRVLYDIENFDFGTDIPMPKKLLSTRLEWVKNLSHLEVSCAIHHSALNNISALRMMDRVELRNHSIRLLESQIAEPK